MLVVRAAGPADFDSMMALAVLSGRGFTSLPDDEPTLRRRLALSEASFAGRAASDEGYFTLMLEDAATGEVIGVAAVKAAIGLKRPHFSFRVVTLAQSSPVLRTRFDHTALVLVNECAGWSEVGSLFLRPERRAGGAGRLLAQSRYMLIGADPRRFAETVLAELRGWFDDEGTCPFWETVGERFFRIPFDQADLMSASTDGQFILDLAPRHPIYVELLPEPARSTVGRVHREGEPARAMLEREGFRHQGLIDIFDAGPTMTCRRDDIRTVQDARVRTLALASEVDEAACLLSTDRIEAFHACRASCAIGAERVTVTGETAALLCLRAGDPVRLLG